MTMLSRKETRSKERKQNPIETPIRILSAVKATTTLTVTFNQPVILRGKPAWTTSVGGATVVSATSRTVIELLSIRAMLPLLRVSSGYDVRAGELRSARPSAAAGRACTRRRVNFGASGPFDSNGLTKRACRSVSDRKRCIHDTCQPIASRMKHRAWSPRSPIRRSCWSPIVARATARVFSRSTFLARTSWSFPSGRTETFW